MKNKLLALPFPKKLIKLKQLYLTGKYEELIIHDQYMYPPIEKDVREIFISQFGESLQDEYIRSFNEEKILKKNKFPLPIIFAFIHHHLKVNKYQNLIKILLQHVDRKTTEDYYIIIYNIAKIYQKFKEYKKSIFYLENVLKEQPFFHLAIYDLCYNYAFRFQRDRQACGILERHINQSLTINHHIFSLYLTVASKFQGRTIKDVVKIMHNKSMCLASYFNMGLYLRKNDELQKSEEIFTEIISKLNRAKTQRSPLFSANDEKLLLLSKINLFLILQRQACEQNRRVQRVQNFSKQILSEFKNILDQETQEKLSQYSQRKGTTLLQTSKSQLLKPIYLRKPMMDESKYKQERTQQYKQIQNKQNFQKLNSFNQEFSSARQYNTKKLKYLLEKQKEINNFFKNLIIKKDASTDKLQIQYKLTEKPASIIANQSLVSKNNPKEDLQIQVFQKQFENKRRVHEFKYDNVEIESMLSQILNNFQNCVAFNKQNNKISEAIKTYKQASSRNPISLRKPIFQVSKKTPTNSISKSPELQSPIEKKQVRSLKTEMTSRNLKSDRNGNFFRIKQTSKDTRQKSQQKFALKDITKKPLIQVNQFKDLPLQKPQKNQNKIQKIQRLAHNQREFMNKQDSQLQHLQTKLMSQPKNNKQKQDKKLQKTLQNKEKVQKNLQQLEKNRSQINLKNLQQKGSMTYVEKKPQKIGQIQLKAEKQVKAQNSQRGKDIFKCFQENEVPNKIKQNNLQLCENQRLQSQLIQQNNNKKELASKNIKYEQSVEKVSKRQLEKESQKSLKQSFSSKSFQSSKQKQSRKQISFKQLKQQQKVQKKSQTKLVKQKSSQKDIESFTRKQLSVKQKQVSQREEILQHKNINKINEPLIGYSQINIADVCQSESSFKSGNRLDSKNYILQPQIQQQQNEFRQKLYQNIITSQINRKQQQTKSTQPVLNTIAESPEINDSQQLSKIQEQPENINAGGEVEKQEENKSQPQEQQRVKVLAPLESTSKQPSYDPMASSFQLTGFNRSSLSKFSEGKRSKISTFQPNKNENYLLAIPQKKQKEAPKPKCSTKFEEQLRQAQLLQAKQQYEKAFHSYTRIYKSYKKESQKQAVLIKIGNLFERQEKFAEAEKTYLKCTKFNNVEAFLKLGALLLKNGRINSGVENIEKANCIKRSDIDIENKLVYGYSLREETMDKALTLAQVILKKEPESLETLIIIANILEKQGKIKEAIEILTALDKFKEAEYIKHYLGILYLHDCNLTEAFNNFKAALAIKPDYLPSLIEVATIISQMSPKQSIEILKKVLEIEPHNRKALARLGKIYESIENDFENAMMVYQTALQTQQNYESYIKIGDCLAKQQSYIEALINYKQALNLKKTHEAYAKIASMFEKKHEIQKAIENYQFALDILSKQKEGGTIIKRKQYLTLLGNLSVRICNYDNAIKYFEDIEDHEESIEIIKLLAEAYFGKKQYTIALERFEKANELANGEDVDILEKVAICFDKLEEYLASKAIYEKILEKDPQNIRCMNNLANILLIMGETNESFYLFESMLQKAPKNIEKRLKVSDIYAEVGDWSKVEFHLLLCIKQRENDERIIERLINLYKEKRDTKMAIKYQKKLGMIQKARKMNQKHAH